MTSQEDHEQLAQATELLTMVMERHRHEDLRALTLFTSAITDIRVGERYLGSVPSTPLR
ncbi:hypothetical protein [Actinokineospora sp.]|uniref:hypothetical protein n=1 Tax=Actinokineospora sp. TaxID=1872133 RepID=UPI003D6C4162